MKDISRDIKRREDQYFFEQEQQRLNEIRRNSAREAQTLRLMEAFGIQEPELVRGLADAGFDLDTFRLLYLVPLIQVAWSDGEVSQSESGQLLEIARLRGIRPGSAAHKRLAAWLAERPSDHFFQVCLRGVRAMLRRRPPSEAQALGRDLVWYCTRIASASGGFLGLGSRISREERLLLTHLATQLDARQHKTVGQVTHELER